MAENQKPPSPQFILWLKEAGVFRPAQLKMPENYIGCDLERNVEVGSQDISPDSLNLVSSVYLGPINIFEEQLETITRSDAYERLREHKYGIAYEIVRLAEDVAKRQGVPYFGVDVVQTGKDRTRKFTERNDFFWTKDDEKEYDLTDKFVKPKKPLEFVLHPTAQLYMQRK